MPAKSEELSEELSEEYLNSLKRKDLLNLCKGEGIKCVGKNSELVEKLLEHFKSSDCSTNTNNVTNYSAISENSFNDFSTLMTPQKRTKDLYLPMVNTPGSPALIKSIVESARKTGLNSSPIRIPFALSPMAARIVDSGTNRVLQYSPMKNTASKEPSLQIREAFLKTEDKGPLLDNNEDKNEMASLSLSFVNKRSHEEDTEDLIESEDAHKHKKEKLDESINFSEKEELDKLGHEENERGNEIEHEHEHEHKIENEHESKSEHGNSAHSMDQKTMDDVETSACSSSSSFISTITSTITSNDNINLSNSDSSIQTSESSSSLNPFSPNFSSELLTNLRDPEFTSPELASAIDTRISRSEHQDFTAANNNLNFSRSNSSSKSNALLPSGLVKLLEKRRQEKEESNSKNRISININHSDFTPNVNVSANSNTAINNTQNSKKKFDLKESLKRPLTYKPHIGSIKPKKEF